MSFLKIAYPQFPFNSVEISSLYATFDETKKLENIANGPRLTWAKGSWDASFGVALRFDGGANFLAVQPEYLIITRADVFSEDVTGIDFWTTADYTTYKNYLNDFIPTANAGPDNVDYLITTFTEQTPERYNGFSIYWTGSYPKTFYLNKIYWGVPFDFGVNPTYEFSKENDTNSSYYMASGTSALKLLDRGRYVFRFLFEGVTDAILESYLTTISERAHRDTYFLYTVTNHKILADFKLLHATLKEERIERKFIDWNNIELTFVEEFG